MDTRARILIIDDDVFFRNLLDLQLSAAGYSVEVAEDAVEGGKVLLRTKFDLVICDINMPFMSGLELGSLLRASAQTASMPVIFATSHMDAETMLAAERLGAAAYLTKPLQSERLLETVERCLRQGQDASADSKAQGAGVQEDRDATAVLGHALQLVLLGEDVFELTVKGRKELDGAGTALSPSELKLLVLIDGKSSVGDTVVRAAALDFGKEAALYILRKLVEDGHIESAKGAGGSLDFVDLFGGETPGKPSIAATLEAEKASAATTLLLQQQGYFVRIVRRPSAKRDLEKGFAPSILVVEDEPVLANLLKHVLEVEGFRVRTAKNRAEIAAEFRRLPYIDLVLLDVMLPDVDGFDVLLHIRRHPALQSLPVMMLTAQATREAVLKGLASGANGYITKPFEIAAMLAAVKTVLGLVEQG
jgi:DNA-binding response OmpR family regulator